MKCEVLLENLMQRGVDMEPMWALEKVRGSNGPSLPRQVSSN